MIDWWCARYSDHVCGCHMPVHVIVSFRYFFSLGNLLHFQPWSEYYHGLTSHITPVLASGPHSSMPSWRKTSAAWGGGKGASATLLLSLPTHFSLFLAVFLSLCLCLSVQQHWLDLLAPGSCYAHNILDQSSLVIGQCGFGQRENRGSCHQQRCLGPLISMDSQRNWPLL